MGRSALSERLRVAFETHLEPHFEQGLGAQATGQVRVQVGLEAHRCDLRGHGVREPALPEESRLEGRERVPRLDQPGVVAERDLGQAQRRIPAEEDHQRAGRGVEAQRVELSREGALGSVGLHTQVVAERVVQVRSPVAPRVRQAQSPTRRAPLSSDTVKPARSSARRGEF